MANALAAGCISSRDCAWFTGLWSRATSVRAATRSQELLDLAEASGE